jgi:hypothetical protein
VPRGRLIATGCPAPGTPAASTPWKAANPSWH